MHSLLAGTHTHSSTAQNLQLYKYSVVNDIYRYSNVHLFPQNVQTGPSVHPASSSMGIGGAFPSRQSSRDIQLCTRTKQVLRLVTHLTFLVPMIHQIYHAKELDLHFMQSSQCCLSFRKIYLKTTACFFKPLLP